MSNQSGIKGSAEMHSAFRDFVSSDDARALVLEIVKESCEPGEVISKGSNNFEEDFEKISAKLDNKSAKYIIIKQNEDPESKYIFISFVPDSAPVRHKMLYASSTNTIHRELGGKERFSTNVFWTDISEVSKSGWKSHIIHENATAPMTEEEKSLQEVLHNEVDQMLGTGERKNEIHRIQLGGKSSGSTGLSLAIDDSVHDSLKELRNISGPSAIGLHIDLDKESVIVGKPVSTINANELGQSFIDNTKPQYTIFKHYHTSSGEEIEKVVFIYTCPSGSKIKERMIYASNRESIISTARNHVDIVKIVEATDGSDISASQLFNELYPDSSESSSAASTPRIGGFARPKRPGRR